MQGGRRVEEHRRGDESDVLGRGLPGLKRRDDQLHDRELRGVFRTGGRESRMNFISSISRVPVPENIEYPLISPPPAGEGGRPFWSVMIPTYNRTKYLA